MHLSTNDEMSSRTIICRLRSVLVLITTVFAVIGCDAGNSADNSRKAQLNRRGSEDGRFQAARIPSGIILQYHHVAEDTPDVTSISPTMFERHLQYLEDNDFVVWSLDRMIGAVRAGESVPDKTVAITFDDAYLNIYENGFPLLRERGWPFTMFVATGLVGSNDRIYMTWDQLAEMQEAGALIENHTRSHTHLLRKRGDESDSAWKARVRSEIVTAGNAIEAHLGARSELFAYPYGEYNDEVMEIVGHLGYVGLGQQSGPIGENSNFLVLPRFPMSGPYSELDSMKTKLHTLPLPVANSDVDPLLPVSETRPSLTLRFTRGDLRFDQLICYGPSAVTITRESELEFVARAESPVPVGRSRYNCTMPTGTPGRFYWFSQMWIRRNDDGSWYPEP